MSELTDKIDQIARTGEPVFVLRAQDIFAPDTVRFWAGQLEMTIGPNSPKTKDAHKLAELMESWQKEHTRKIPD